MNEHYYAVIMAGGGGTRLWPLSRKETPKQMLKIFGERTLFQIAIQRLEGVFSADHILVVTVADQAAKLKEQWPEIPDENYLIEPMPRGTASVVGMAAVALARRDPQASMAILTADHFIQDEAKFRERLNAGCDLAPQGYLVTLGIHPTYPATGYGYIQRGERLGSYQGMEAFRVLSFKEKPDEARARDMLQSGDHDWNSGMFIWRVDRILEEFGRHMPVLAKELDAISADWDTPQRNETLQRIWPGIKAETIDYGIMEKAAQVAVLPAEGLGWNDVGSWDSLFDVLPGDEHGNILLGADPILVDTERSLIADSTRQRLIVAVGVKDLVVIDTGDALLVCHKDAAQQVKTVVNKLKETKQDQYL
jgi:mannose-1-phosphate guanylyltransferase